MEKRAREVGLALALVRLRMLDPQLPLQLRTRSGPRIYHRRQKFALGNMYFANSVLQIMVYCPPFHRLFAELGAVLGGSGPSSGLGVSSGMNGIYGVGRTSGNGTAAEASTYLLVEATVEFLREFVVDDRSKDL